MSNLCTLFNSIFAQFLQLNVKGRGKTLCRVGNSYILLSGLSYWYLGVKFRFIKVFKLFPLAVQMQLFEI